MSDSPDPDAEVPAEIPPSGLTQDYMTRGLPFPPWWVLLLLVFGTAGFVLGVSWLVSR